jgi:hypothetical protein
VYIEINPKCAREFSPIRWMGGGGALAALRVKRNNTRFVVLSGVFPNIDDSRLVCYTSSMNDKQ